MSKLEVFHSKNCSKRHTTTRTPASNALGAESLEHWDHNQEQQEPKSKLKSGDIATPAQYAKSCNQPEPNS